MKRHKLIGFGLWTVANILLILRLREYLIIAPVLAVQVVIGICCGVLFCVVISSRDICIGINIVAILVRLITIFYINFSHLDKLCAIFVPPFCVSEYFRFFRSSVNDFVSPQVYSRIFRLTHPTSIARPLGMFRVSW